MALPSPAADRTCLVTGASSGIGVEIARVLASRGHGVVITARRQDALEKVAADLRATYRVRVEVLACDLTDGAARRALPGRVSDLGLTVDVLVNNAGFGSTGAFLDSTEEREVSLVQTNSEAVVSLCSLFMGGMRERRRGAVLNVASTASFQPMPGSATYAASKVFVVYFSEALRAEMRPFGVSVTALCPGPVQTEFNDVAGISDERAAAAPKFMWRSAEAVARAGVDGLAAGRPVVVPGLPNRLLGSLASYTPHRLLVPIMERLSPFA
jgi:short-subunit dehydrogenase